MRRVNDGAHFDRKQISSEHRAHCEPLLLFLGPKPGKKEIKLDSMKCIYERQYSHQPFG